MMDFTNALTSRPNLFPQTIRIERRGSENGAAQQRPEYSATGQRIGGGYNATGQRTGGGWVPVAGLESLKAQSAPPKRGSGGESNQADTIRALSMRMWTLPGRVEGIASSMRLIELNAQGAELGAYDILAVDVSCFGIHTVIETKQAT